MIDTALVMPEMKSRKNHANPAIAPPGMWLKISGVVLKAKPKVPPLTAEEVPSGPKKMYAAGTTIDAPSTTSANLLRKAAEVADNSASSFDFM